MTAQTTPASPTGFTPIDSDARSIIGEHLEETLFVEASAGTGKTSSLVRRVVNLVATGKGTLDRIAAITFTEAAAAELRDRARQELERAAEDSARSEEERKRCRQGIADLDQAAIRTLHAFAALLLHERPLEAGLPPAFETTDEIAAGIKFNEVWNTWLDKALEEDSPLAPHFAIAITLGMTVSQLKDTALEFHKNYTDLTGVSFNGAATPAASATGMLADEWPKVEHLCQFSKLGGEDLLYRHIQTKAGTLRRLAEAEPGSSGACRLLRRVLPLKSSRGRQSDWDVDPSTGDNACAALKRNAQRNGRHGIRGNCTGPAGRPAADTGGPARVRPGLRPTAQKRGAGRVSRPAGMGPRAVARRLGSAGPLPAALLTPANRRSPGHRSNSGRNRHVPGRSRTGRDFTRPAVRCMGADYS